VSSVLVTGGSGFIGRNALAPLRERGYEVHAPGSREADLLAPGTAADLIAELRPTHLLHFAWDARPGKYWTSTDNLEWVEGSLRLLRAFAEGGGRRAVLAGTCAEYEWTDEVHCVEGATPLAPATLYGAAKHGLHVTAERYASQAGVSFAWGRIFFVFGPHEHHARLASSVASALVRGEPAEAGAGTQVRDFLYSEDLGDAFAALLDSAVEGAVNMASGEPRAIRDLVVALGDAAGRPDLLRIGARPPNPGEPASITAAVDRLRDEVGWRPPRTLEQRAADTIAWWRQAAPAP
jgi:nucleoside-diphosphate-sugar epimerase